MSVPEYIELENGDRMPRIGFGTWQAPPDVLEPSVDAALAAGYRHFDSANVYENEAALGRALNRWIGGDPKKRKELFVVTKLAPGGNKPELVEEYFNSSFRELGLEYIDLYLIHVPFGFLHVPGDLHPKNPDGTIKIEYNTDLEAVWKAVLKLKESGRVRHVGVSNMNEEQITRLNAIAKPACLQVEMHVLMQQGPLIAAANKLGIPVVAYSPLGSKALTDSLSAKTGRSYPSLLELPEVEKIAKTHSRTPAQILLRFLLQKGVAVIPKSTNPIRIKQNISLWDFELSEKEMQELTSLDRGEDGRICDFLFFGDVKKHSEAVLKLKESGRVRHVGVSNMNEEQITRLNAIAKPACLQVEMHVLMQQGPLIAAANKLGIPVVAYSPLGSKALTDSLSAKTGRSYPSLLELPEVEKIAKTHSRTPAQILLRFLLQKGVAVIPKSTNPIRIKQNISLWDFELSEKEMQELTSLDRGEDGRICDFLFFGDVKKHSEYPFKK